MSTKRWGSIGALVLAVIGGVVAIEGGYVNDPNDAGGATKHGITEQVARQRGYTGAMQALPQTVAIEIYAQDYVYKPRFDRVAAQSPAVGTKLIDAGVNAGPGRSAKWLQQSLNDLSRGGRDYRKIAVDGVVGPATLAAYQALEQKRGRTKACELMLKAFESYQAGHYLSLAQDQANSSFVVGWLEHRVGNVQPQRCEERVLQ